MLTNQEAARRKIAIVTGGTPNLMGPAGVLFLSLQCFSADFFENADKYFFVAGRGEDDNSNALSRIDVKITTLPDTLEWNSKNPSLEHFTTGVLSKFQVFRLSGRYDNVTWMDCDQINTANLWSSFVELQSFQMFVVDSGGNGLIDFHEKHPRLDLLIKKGLFDPAQAPICGNYFGVNSHLTHLYPESLRLFKDLQAELYMPDQGVLNILLQNEIRTIARLSNKLYTPHPADCPTSRLLRMDQEPPYFVHCYGQPKFWSGFHYPLWMEFYEAWLDLGGTPFLAEKDTTKPRLLKRAFQKVSNLFKLLP